MDDLERLLERRARWQRSRRNLSWSEKIRIAEKVRDDIVALRSKTPKKGAQSGPGTSPPPSSRDE